MGGVCCTGAVLSVMIAWRFCCDNLFLFLRMSCNRGSKLPSIPTKIPKPQVDGSILVAWIGNLATKLALAASNCALSLRLGRAGEDFGLESFRVVVPLTEYL